MGCRCSLQVQKAVACDERDVERCSSRMAAIPASAAVSLNAERALQRADRWAALGAASAAAADAALVEWSAMSADCVRL